EFREALREASDEMVKLEVKEAGRKQAYVGIVAPLLEQFGSHICTNVILGGYWKIKAKFESDSSTSVNRASSMASEAIETAAAWSIKGEASVGWGGPEGWAGLLWNALGGPRSHVSVSAEHTESHDTSESESHAKSSETGLATENSVMDVFQEWKGGISGAAAAEWRKSLADSENWKIIDRHVDECFGTWEWIDESYHEDLAQAMKTSWADKFVDSLDWGMKESSKQSIKKALSNHYEGSLFVHLQHACHKLKGVLSKRNRHCVTFETQTATSKFIQNYRGEEELRLNAFAFAHCKQSEDGFSGAFALGFVKSLGKPDDSSDDFSPRYETAILKEAFTMNCLRGTAMKHFPNEQIDTFFPDNNVPKAFVIIGQAQKACRSRHLAAGIALGELGLLCFEPEVVHFEYKMMVHHIPKELNLTALNVEASQWCQRRSWDTGFPTEFHYNDDGNTNRGWTQSAVLHMACLGLKRPKLMPMHHPHQRFRV
ncbi:unnamed protein product, partial [Symbiodinium sp. CCMP2456]